MFTLKTYDLGDINSTRALLDLLFETFRSTLNPELTRMEFNRYFFSQHPEAMEISFIHKEDNLAGFCTSAANPRKMNGKKVVIIRSSFGLLDTYEKGNFPLHGLFYKYMRYKLKHLFTPVYVAGFMANPLMYAMICKYTHTCYPRRNKKLSPALIDFKNDLLQSMNLQSKELAPFVLKIHFQVRFNESDVKRFESSDDKNVKYFLSINPGYRNQIGVMVLVPVTITNMMFTFIKYAFRKVRKKIKNINNTQTKKSLT